MANGPEDHPDMSCEQERFRSFSHGWRGDSSPCLLASAGYYYTKSGDLVKCFSCGGTVNNWNHRMDPYEVHRQMFPNCALVNNTEHRHQPWIPSTQATLLVEQAFRDPLISVASTPNLMGITTPVVRSPQMLNALLTHQAQVSSAEGHSDDHMSTENRGHFREFLEQVKALPLKKKCLLCDERPACIQFEPCRHLACCIQCSVHGETNVCPKCGETGQLGDDLVVPVDHDIA